MVSTLRFVPGVNKIIEIAITQIIVDSIVKTVIERGIQRDREIERQRDTQQAISINFKVKTAPNTGTFDASMSKIQLLLYFFSFIKCCGTNAPSLNLLDYSIILWFRFSMCVCMLMVY